MSTETITFVNFVVHSFVIGAAAWLMVRFIMRDVLRRCILANLAVLICLCCPFDLSFRELFPTKKIVPVLSPIRETLEHDWRVKVEPQKDIAAARPLPTADPSWDVNDLVKWMCRLSFLVTAALLLRLLLQSLGVQRWAWHLRLPSAVEGEKLPTELNVGRLRVFDGQCTPCAAGWFFPVIAVPASAFNELTPQQWRWLIRHESEHLRAKDTVAALLQNIALAFLWWNPFVHALIGEFARAREEACDAAAVGEEPDYTPYADFLLSWAAKPSANRLVMPIARSRPARRLKDRLVALVEARGVRKKLGAWFVLGCLVFAVVAPFVAASFGVATAAAQETVNASPEDTTMFMRLYKVAPNFLPDGSTARQLLEDKGIPFPEGSSALYQAATSQLIVRHTRAALDQIEALVDRLHLRLPQVYFQCKLIQAETFIGKHDSILKPEEAKELLAQVSQNKGIDLMSSPSVTTKMGQEATVEVVREVFPSKPQANDTFPMKLIGPSINLVANPAPEGKASIEAKVDLGIDPDAQLPWLPNKEAKPDWSRIQTFTVSSKAVLASGETLLLHLPTAKKPVTVLITAEALNPTGQKAISFESTATMQPSKTVMNLPDKAVSEWAVRVYKLPQNFPRDKPPVVVLKAAGVAFPKGADAMFKDEKLTVRNTKPNLELIEGWLDAMIRVEVKKTVRLTVQAVEVKGDFLKMMNDWLEPSTSKVKATEPPVNTEPLPPAVLLQFTVAGVFAAPQLEKIASRLADSGTKLEALQSKQKTLMYDLPAAWGGQEMRIEPVIGPDGYTIDLVVQIPPLEPTPARRISTAVTIWSGQTLLLGAQPKDGISRLLFITGQILEEQEKVTK